MESEKTMLELKNSKGHILKVADKEWPEIESMRSLSGKTYKGPGKEYGFVASVGPRHYKEEGLEAKGPFLDVDMSDPDNLKALYHLTRTKDGIGYTWQAREPGSPAITVKLRGTGKLPIPDIRDEGVVYYTDVAKDLDIYLKPLPDRYGIFKVLKGPEAPTTFEFDISWTGKPKEAVTKAKDISRSELSAEIAKGIDDLEYLHFDNCCHLPPCVAWDGEGGRVEVKKSIRGNVLTEEIILPEKVAWPVTVDTDVSYQVGAGNDDGWVASQMYGSGGNPVFNDNNPHLYVGHHVMIYDVDAWIRFTNISIPNFATIIDATLHYVYVWPGASGDIPLCKTEVYLNKVNNAQSPTSYNDYHSKVLTNNFVQWNIDSIITDVWYNSPNLKDIIQEVIDMPGWVLGNALLVLHLHTEDNYTNFAAIDFAAYESGATYSPKLFITYTTGPSLSTNPATNIEDTTATLNGKLDDDNNEDCYCYFEYGKTTSYGSETSKILKTTGQTFSVNISGLDPNTTYHFRAVVDGDDDTYYGEDETFITKLAKPILSAGKDATGEAILLSWGVS